MFADSPSLGAGCKAREEGGVGRGVKAGWGTAPMPLLRGRRVMTSASLTMRNVSGISAL